MHREEIVIRSLIREWLIIEQASEVGEKAGAEAAGVLSGLSSLESQLDAALDKIDDKVEEKNEALVALALGLGLSIPTLAKWATKATALAVKGYVSLASKFSDADQSNKAAWAAQVEQAGVSFYEKGHHLIEGAYTKIVKVLFLLLCAMGDPGGMDAYKAWADSSAGEEAFLKVAKILDLAVTCVLAVYSVNGTVQAVKTAHTALAATEGVLSAVKGAHIGAAVSEAVTAAFRAFANAFVEAGVAAALVSDLMKKAKEVFAAIKDTLTAGVDATKKAATAAGLAVALAAGSGASDEAPDSGSSSAQRG